MPTRPWRELIDERYPPGTQERREYEFHRRRIRRVNSITEKVYDVLFRIPPKWPTGYDEVFGPTRYRGIGPVVAQFWYDILGGILNSWIDRDLEGKATPRDIFYNALDGLAWRFFNDEYVPTWADVKRGQAGKRRWTWRMRRRHAIEVAEHYADQYHQENSLPAG